MDFPLKGERLGPYQIEELIGQGGMGSVYRAVRQDGVFERDVAVKVLKLGMDSDALVRRFYREQAVMARLNHPFIVRLYDSGVLADGRPYLVMEYVEGSTLLEYCASHNLSVQNRLKLFRKICDAVHDAHRSLVIHCDLKPSNILIDASGDPHLLDFGIAQLLNPDEDGHTVVKAFSKDFAAPEQLQGARVTTMTDVFALGRILCAMLDGTGLASKGLIKGPAGSIVAKALRTDPELRYGSAAELGEDVARFYQGFPVQAHRGNAWYGLSRFVIRNPLVAAAFMLTIVLGVSIGVAQTLEQREKARQRLLAEEALEEAMADRAANLDALFFIDRLFEKTEAVPDASSIQILDVGVKEVGHMRQRPMQARLMSAIGSVYLVLGLFKEGVALLEQALVIQRETLGSDHPEVAKTLIILGSLQQYADRADLAGDLFFEALEIREKHYEGDHLALAEVHAKLGDYHLDAREYTKAKERFFEALAMRIRLLGPRHIQLAELYSMIAYYYIRVGKPDEAIASLEKALELREELQGKEHYRYALDLNFMGQMYLGRGDRLKALQFFRNGAGLLSASMGENHPILCNPYKFIATIHRDLGDYETSESYLNRVIHISSQSNGGSNPYLGIYHDDLARLFLNTGRISEAESHFKKSLAIKLKHYGEAHLRVMFTEMAIAETYVRSGRTAEALSIMEKSALKTREKYGAGSYAYNRLLRKRADIHSFLGEWEEALVFQGEAETLLSEDIEHLRWHIWREMALSYQRGGRFEKSISLLDRCQKALTNQDFSSSLSRIRGEKALNFQSLGDFEQAEIEFGKARDLVTDVVGDDHPRIGGIDLHLSAIHLKKGAVGEGLELAMNAKKILEARFSSEYKLVEVANTLIGASFFLKGDFKQAEGMLVSSAESLKDLYGVDRSYYAENLLWQIKLYEAMGNKEKLEVVERALHGLPANLPVVDSLM